MGSRGSTWAGLRPFALSRVVLAIPEPPPPRGSDLPGRAETYVTKFFFETTQRLALVADEMHRTGPSSFSPPRSPLASPLPAAPKLEKINEIMTIHTRTLLALAPLALGACFDPAFDPNDTGRTETDTDGTSTGASASTADTDTESAEGQVDSTGPVDAPPQLTAFTVNNSTTPAEQQVTGFVAFDVDAVDDVGIDHVEIYDGDELVATVSESPYRTEILVTSADNGSHQYSAIVFDTAGQTDESEVVPLSVNVVGGAILELREDIGDVQVVLGRGAPLVTTLPDGNVIVTGMTLVGAEPEPRTGLLARGYNAELSLLWSMEHEPPLVPTTVGYMGFSDPSPSATQPVVYVSGLVLPTTEILESTIFTLDTRSGALTDTHTLWPHGQYPYLAVAAAPNGDVFGTASSSEVARYSADLSVEQWRSDPLGEPVHLVSTAEGETVVVSRGDGCAAESAMCIRKLAVSTGDILWTRFLVGGGSAGFPTRPAISSDGHIATAFRHEDGSAELLVFDDQGNEISNLSIIGMDLGPQSIVYTPGDDLVLAGHVEHSGDPMAWATRIKEDGTEVWSQVYSVGKVDSLADAVAVSPNGRLYLSGQADRFDFELFSNAARAWVAEIAL